MAPAYEQPSADTEKQVFWMNWWKYEAYGKLGDGLLFSEDYWWVYWPIEPIVFWNLKN